MNFFIFFIFFAFGSCGKRRRCWCGGGGLRCGVECGVMGVVLTLVRMLVKMQRLDGGFVKGFPGFVESSVKTP